jgi:anaerobic magnesium-protoporphyrin IX monomethyl ester cyclase
VNYLIDNHDVDGIGFWDDYFLADMNRAMEILKFLKKNDIAFLCESRADVLTKEFSKILKDHGCLQVFVGGESGSQRVLDIIKKDIHVEDILNAAKNTEEAGLPMRVSFMYGIPGENVEDMMKTKSVILKLLEYHHLSISGPKIYTPYPGTPLYDESLKRGFVPPASTLGWKDIHRSVNVDLLPWFKKELEKNDVTKDDLFSEIRDKEKELGLYEGALSKKS